MLFRSKFPAVRFAHCGGLWNAAKHPKNVGSFFGYIDECQYLNGVVAGHVTKSKKLGFVLDSDVIVPNKDEMLAMGDRTPAGRIVEPQDMANAVAWLAGPESAMIVGQTLIIDGGYSLPA